MEFLNPHDQPLLMLGSDDGAVRIWRNYENNNQKLPQLVTAWQALTDMLPSSKGKYVCDMKRAFVNLYFVYFYMSICKKLIRFGFS